MPAHYVHAIAVLLLLALASVTSADDANVFTPPSIRVPDGFTVEVAAAPPLVKYPMLACFDERGRLFVAETLGQNLVAKELLEKKCRFIRMLEDTDGDGKFDKSTIFADKLVMPQGALWHHGSLYVLSSPYLWRFKDTDDDGRADVRERLVGYFDLGEAHANQSGGYIGPNGRVFFSGGIYGYDLTGKDGKHVVKGKANAVFSCRRDGTDVEVFSNGTVNTVEVVFTPEGEMLTTCPIFDTIGGRHDALVHWVRGSLGGPTDFAPPVLKETGFRLPAARRWGQVAPAGLMRYRGTVYGAEYKNTFFSAHFNTAKVVHTRLERTGATYRGEDEDFLVSTSRDFHPTDVLEDADGSLLVIDTGGWHRISCPLSKIAKPEILGAIYRVRKTDSPPVNDPLGLTLSWKDATDVELADHLDDPRPFVRDHAMTELVERGDQAAATLGRVFARRRLYGTQSVQKRRNAVWTLSRIGSTGARKLIRLALDDPDPTVKQASVRSLGVLQDNGTVPQLLKMISGKSLPLRRAIASALGEIGDPAAVPYLLDACALGGDEHLMHALIYALIEISNFDRTVEGLAKSNAQVQYAALVALDRMDDQRLTQQHVAPLLESDDAILRRTALEIVTNREGWSDQIIDFLKDWVAEKELDLADVSVAHGAIVAFSQDKRVQQLVQRAMRSSETTLDVRLALLEGVGRVRNLPDAWVNPLGILLRSESESVRLQAIAAIHSSGTTLLHSQLTRLGKDKQASDDVRRKAWSCLAGKGFPLPEEAFALLMERVTAEILPLERLAAAKAIASARLNRPQLLEVTAVFSDAGPLELPALIEAFGQQKQFDSVLAKRFLAALEGAKAANSLSVAKLETVLQNFPKDLHGSAKPLLAKLRIGDQEMAARLKQVTSQLVEGDALQGKAIFFSNRTACGACHTVRGKGGNIGPDLSRIGTIRTRRDLLEAILFPSSTIVNNYETYSVATTDGRILHGIIQRANRRSIVLRNAERSEIVISPNDVEELVRNQTSIMPKGLDTNLIPQQLSDLLAYLESLRP